jgi:hypothetical protein
VHVATPAVPVHVVTPPVRVASAPAPAAPRVASVHPSRGIFTLPTWLLVATIFVSLSVGVAGITMFLVY